MRKYVISFAVALTLLLGTAVYFYLTAGSTYVADYFVRQGAKKAEMGDVAGASKHYGYALKFNPYDSDSRIRLSALNLQMGNVYLAEQLLLEGIELLPASGACYIELSKIYVSVGKIEQAVNVLDRVEPGYSVINIAKKRPDHIPALPSGRYESGTCFTIEKQAGVQYYYNLEGEWYVYGHPLALTEGAHKIKAVAVPKDGLPSKIMEFDYTIEAQKQVAMAPLALSESVKAYIDAQLEQALNERALNTALDTAAAAPNWQEALDGIIGQKVKEALESAPGY